MNDDFLNNLDAMIERYGVWVDYIVRALTFHPRGLRRGDVLLLIRADAFVRGRTLPRSYSDTVQAVFNRNNAHSRLFKGDPGKALFCLAEGKRGVWKLSDQAMAR